MFFRHFLAFFLFIACFFCQAQVGPDSLQTQPDASLTKVSQGSIFVHDFKCYYKGLGNFFSRPAHWKGKDWRNVGLVVGGTILTVALDQPTRRFMKNNQSEVLDVFERGGDLMGRPVPGFVFSGAMYGIGHMAKNNWMRETAIITLTSISTAGLIQTIAKGSIGRARPTEGIGNLRFKPFDPAPGFHSFPSGHTIVAASTTLAIAKNIKNKYIKTGIVALGALTAWSRVYVGAHWLSDVSLSYALSYFTVETVTRFRKAYNERHPDKRFSMRFVPTFNGGALVINF